LDWAGLLCAMPTRLARRIAAPLLVVAGAALFGLGAGGIARVDARLEAAVQPPVQTGQPPPQEPFDVEDRHGVRGMRPHSDHGEL
jgi:hypothetical protein